MRTYFAYHSDGNLTPGRAPEYVRLAPHCISPWHARPPTLHCKKQKISHYNRISILISFLFSFILKGVNNLMNEFLYFPFSFNNLRLLLFGGAVARQCAFETKSSAKNTQQINCITLIGQPTHRGIVTSPKSILFFWHLIFSFDYCCLFLFLTQRLRHRSINCFIL